MVYERHEVKVSKRELGKSTECVLEECVFFGIWMGCYVDMLGPYDI